MSAENNLTKYLSNIDYEVGDTPVTRDELLFMARTALAQSLQHNDKSLLKNFLQTLPNNGTILTAPINPKGETIMGELRKQIDATLKTDTLPKKHPVVVFSSDQTQPQSPKESPEPKPYLLLIVRDIDDLDIENSQEITTVHLAKPEAFSYAVLNHLFDNLPNLDTIQTPPGLYNSQFKISHRKKDLIEKNNIKIVQAKLKIKPRRKHKKEALSKPKKTEILAKLGISNDFLDQAKTDPEMKRRLRNILSIGEFSPPDELETDRWPTWNLLMKKRRSKKSRQWLNLVINHRDWHQALSAYYQIGNYRHEVTPLEEIPDQLNNHPQVVLESIQQALAFLKIPKL